MHVLALDTTTRAGSVAIVRDDDVLFERGGDPARSHAERLPIDLLAALDACHLSSSDIDIFAVASGPGSFTGLRIGIATMQGFALTHGTRLVAVSALMALAEVASHDAQPGDLVAAWMDAHRRDVFSLLVRVQDRPRFAIDRLVELDAAAVGTPGSTLERWHSMNLGPAVVAGDGAEMYAGLLAGQSRVMAVPVLAGTIGRMAQVQAGAGLAIEPSGVRPLYVRRPDVEVARDTRASAPGS